MEGPALCSSLLERVVVENEGILPYGSMFVTCFGFVELVNARGGGSDKRNERPMV